MHFLFTQNKNLRILCCERIFSELSISILNAYESLSITHLIEYYYLEYKKHYKTKHQEKMNEN